MSEKEGGLKSIVDVMVAGYLARCNVCYLDYFAFLVLACLNNELLLPLDFL